MDAAAQAGVGAEERRGGSYMSLGGEAAGVAAAGEEQPPAEEGIPPEEPEPEPEPEPIAEPEPEPEPEALVEHQLLDAAAVSGVGEWQIGGKGKFHSASISISGVELTVTSLETKGKHAGDVLARGSVQDCTVSKPKNERKGHPHSLRIDLARAETVKQGTKFLLSVSDNGELLKWTAALVQHSHAAAEVRRMKEKGPEFLGTVLPTVDLDKMRHQIWRAYISSLDKEQQKAADEDLRRGTSSKANTAAKRASHARLSTAVDLAKVTQLVNVPAAEQLPLLELYVLERCFMREGTGPNGKWCELQFGEEPPIWGPIPAGPGRVRLQVAREIAKTERSYVMALQTLVEQYLKPLRDGGIVPDADLRTIFGQVEVMVGFGEALLEQFETVVGHWDSTTSMLGPIFLEFAAYLKVYVPFINGFNDALDAVGRLEKSSKEFATVLEEQREVADGLGLADLLIQPIQRVPRYRLLLEELLKHTPEEHADYTQCVGALDQIKHVATELNEAKRTAELKLNTMERLRQLNAVDLMEPHRSIVKDGLLDCELPLPGQGFAESAAELSAKSSHIFLFSDILIHAVYFTPPSRWKQEDGSTAQADPKESQRLMPMHRMLLDCDETVLEVGSPSKNLKKTKSKKQTEWAETLARSFTIRDGRGQAWRLFAETDELKAEWMAAIQGAVSALGDVIVEDLGGGSERTLTRLKTTADTKDD